MVSRPYATLLALVAVAPLAVAPPRALAQSSRTVSHYLQNPAERAQKLRACWNDEALSREPECANAQRAADQARQRPRPAPPPTPTPEQTLTSPSYYAENRVARDITLDKCSRNAAPAADCRAAVASLRSR